MSPNWTDENGISHFGEEEEKRAVELVELGYRAISRKHRLVARLPGPPGEITAREALEAADPGIYSPTLTEAQCLDQYVRVHAKDRLTLDPLTFKAFLRAKK